MQAAEYINTADILVPLKKAGDPFLTFTSKAGRKWGEKKRLEVEAWMYGEDLWLFCCENAETQNISQKSRPGLLQQPSFTLINSL